MTQTIPIPDEQKPEEMLAAVVALRRMADGLEHRAVSIALSDGWSWAQISEALGVSRQAAHKRLSHISPKSRHAKE